MSLPAPHQDLSAFALLHAVLVAAIGPEMAVFASAYLLIVLGWMFGMLVGALRLPVRNRTALGRKPLAILAVSSLFAVFVLSVPLADALHGLLHEHWPSLSYGDEKNLLAPLAFAIPAIGHNWVDIGRKAWSKTPFASSTGASEPKP